MKKNKQIIPSNFSAYNRINTYKNSVSAGNRRMKLRPNKNNVKNMTSFYAKKDKKTVRRKSDIITVSYRINYMTPYSFW